MGSEFYHDYYRWPLKDRRVFETWSRETPWGRLFVEWLAAGEGLRHGASRRREREGPRRKRRPSSAEDVYPGRSASARPSP